MKRLLPTIFLLSIAILIIGAGCATKKPAPTQTDTTKKTEIIKKKPQTEEPTNPSHDYCQKTGNEIIIRMDQTTTSSIAYCRFADGTECEAEKYFKQSCAPGQGAKPYQPPEQFDNFSVCTNEYEPVCGANGINYTNACLAQTQGIIISHKGVCKPSELKQPENTIDSSAPAVNQNKSNTTVENQDAVDTGWLGIIKDFALSMPKSNPPAFIEKCVYSNNPIYYSSPGCDGCVTTLYDKTGKVICYPSNDIDNDCPPYFTSVYRANSCSKIWQDSRP